MVSKQPQKTKVAWHWTLAAICAVVILAIIGLTILNIAPGKNVRNYAECKDAGGSIAESFPEQCIINGKTYVNGSATSGNKTNTEGPDGYVGLSEQDALDKAQSQNKPARVVERNGEALAIDMSFVKGRLNLTINNGIVEKVQVEE